jgi:formiminoglutamase
MKDLSIYFKGLSKSENDIISGSIGEKAIINFGDNFENPAPYSIAILSVPEFRNSTISPQTDLSIINDKINDLQFGDWKTPVYLLGTILPGNSIGDTYLALREVVFELVKDNVFPIVIGGSQDLTFPIFQAYKDLEQTVNILDIDPALDMGDPEEPIDSNSWLNKILLEKPNYLFNYSLLGYQSYLVKTEESSLVSKLLFDTTRLGEFYKDNKLVEPLVRNADILTFDLDAIRGSDYNGNTRDLPHGIYGEDACAIMRYAGLSDKLTSLGVFNFNNSVKSNFDANLVAQMIWYFIEGFNNRKKDYPIGVKTDYTKYHVSIDDFKDQITFYKSDKSGRWWMEVPYPKVKGARFQRHLLVPCNYEDYQNALTNEMPNLWWKTFEKLA